MNHTGLVSERNPSHRPRAPRWAGAVALGLAALVAGGCTDEDVVFRERDIFEQPPDVQNNFLGYTDVAEQLTVCGNCHVEKQALWETTGHSEAWATLQANPGAQAFCEGCHAVSENGNALTTAAGINVARSERYQDVQCENCHNSGFDHVQNPEFVKPLAFIGVGTEDETNGCADCHQGEHHPFVEQWRDSRHGSGPALAIAGGNPTCQPCHEGRSAMVNKFGETSNFVEINDEEPMRITCAVCHDPHGSPNDANLRAPIDVATEDHLCVTCHARQGAPPSFRGPHAAQGFQILGINVGWIPPGFSLDTARIIGSHGTEANPKLCATCHVDRFEVTDAITGDFVFQAVGHTFEAIPCLDAEGIPTMGPCTEDQRTFRACAASGCHTGEDAARSLFINNRDRINGLLDELWFDTDADAAMDVTDAGLLPQVVAQGDTIELDLRDQQVTVAEGALWNAQLAYTSERPWFGGGTIFGASFSSHKSSGDGAHNPFLLEALLTASIQAVIDRYGVMPSPNLDLRIRATPPPGLSLR